MQGLRSGLLVGLVFLAVFAASYGYLQLTAPPLPAEQSSASETTALPPPAPSLPPPDVIPGAVPPTMGQGAPPPIPNEAGGGAPPPSENTDIASAEPEYPDIVPGAGMPPAAAADPPGGAPVAPRSTSDGGFSGLSGGSAPVAPSSPAVVPPPPPPPPMAALPPAPHDPISALPPAAHDPAPSAMPPAAHDPAPSAMPPAAHDPAPSAMPPAAAADPPVLPRGAKVLSYFQQTKTDLDTTKAFGFVLLPKSAVTAEEKRIQKQFCQIVLSTMDYMTPGAVAAASVRTEILATYWPIVASRRSLEINAAFEDRNCDQLLAWYDHKLARSLATKAGVAGLSGPLLITWPSSGADGDEARNPLIVDFSKADYVRATKTLQYWFRQVRGRPDLWTNRIREGTIRAELADAVNDTAGVVLAVLYGKWDSVNAVAMP